MVSNVMMGGLKERHFRVNVGWRGERVTAQGIVYLGRNPNNSKLWDVTWLPYKDLGRAIGHTSIFVTFRDAFRRFVQLRTEGA